MRRWRWGMLAGATMVLAACWGGDGGEVREVLVDYLDDEVASSFLLYFPSDVTVRPGDTVVFKQEWTGEPHSVTMGTMVDEMMDAIVPLIDEYGDLPDDQIPPEVFEAFDAAVEPLPWMMGDDFDIQQNGAQPCYLGEGVPPDDPDQPCEEQEQPEFNGRQSYYNSGFIPYEGPEGNEFRVSLADDIEPGVYNYYCNLHGPFQKGTITVVEPESEIPSQTEVSRQARAEIEAVAEPLRAALTEAATAETTDVFGQTVKKPLAGYLDEATHQAFISEFIPRRIEIPVGEAVTWQFVGAHTVSFDVPEYFAQMMVDEDGTVTLNPDAIQPVNSPGAPEDPEEEGGEEPPPGEDGPPPDEEAAPPDEGPPPEPVAVDAGEWNGSGFISSGIFYEDRYRLTFTEPGTYPYACLIHPQMVGEVVVR